MLRRAVLHKSHSTAASRRRRGANLARAVVYPARTEALERRVLLSAITQRPTAAGMDQGPTASSTPHLRQSSDTVVTQPYTPQATGASFLGAQVSDTPGFVPPDSMGDVGPTQVLVA